ncbi:hypothetical protein [Methanosarcina mazei]|uniref:Uncharacterized protein n=1 Tax=Methanosarcina mazei TaxID=2209 RepID=A0A6C0VJ86_METMZ|nr:hypothetical protein [Methanosarcina mazei]QIB90996.1 hypothetical protein FQU78_07950 [Methanosarcina mazei]
MTVVTIYKSGFVSNIIYPIDPRGETKSRIYLTENLANEILVSDFSTFERATFELYDMLNEWVERAFLKDNSGLKKDLSYTLKKLRLLNPILDMEERLGLPIVILGTKEEVIRHRNKFKRRESEVFQEDLDQMRLELIHLLSDDACCNINNIHEISTKLNLLCEQMKDRDDRYAFFVPRSCSYPFKVINDLSSLTNEYSRCKIHCELNPNKIEGELSFIMDSGFIMMPYDYNENDYWSTSFNPKFYQALFHELFHFLVIDIYRGSTQINEGLAECYSEVYYQFLKTYLEDFRDSDKETEFSNEYMKFTKIGEYLDYYKYVITETSISDYYHFMLLVYMLVDKGIKSNEKNILNCRQKTVGWEGIFRDTCEELKKMRS